MKKNGLFDGRLTEKCLADIQKLMDMAREVNAAKISFDLNFHEPKVKVSLAIVKHEGVFWYLGRHYRLTKSGKAIPLNLLRKLDIRNFKERLKVVRRRKLSRQKPV